MKTIRTSTLFKLPMMAMMVLACFGCKPSPSTSQGGVEIVDTRTRPKPEGAPVGAAYFTLINDGKEDNRLISVSSLHVETIELHETIDSQGVLKMREATNGFSIPAGEKFNLEPGGPHLMLLGIRKELKPGSFLPVTLEFEKGGARALDIQVVE